MDSQQMSLALTSPSRWGGHRRGAGRKAGSRRRIPHRSRNGVARRFPCHVTLTMRPDVPNLRSAKLVRMLEASFVSLGDEAPTRLAHYSIQGNHVHLIVEARDRNALGRGMKSISARIARAVNRAFARRGPVIADRYHLHVLRTPREVWNASATSF